MALTAGGEPLPCKNPSCKSQGTSHPNCRCYMNDPSVQMADGGHVGHYCSHNKAHQADCEYYADGGTVSPDFDSMPDEGAQQQQAPTNFDAIQEDRPQFDELPEDNAPPSLKDHILAGIEGAAQGVLGPIAPYIETHPWAKHIASGVIGGPIGQALADQYSPTEEELAARSDLPSHAAGEALGLAGSLLTGTGEAGLIAKGTKALVPEAASFLGKVGAGALKNAIEGGLLQGGNEISDAMIGKGDPNTPVSAALSHMGAAALLSAIPGGIFGGASKGIQALSNTKIGQNINNLIAGIGAANVASKMSEVSPELSEALELEGNPWFKKGVSLHDKITDPSVLSKSALRSAATGIGYKAGGLPGGAAGEYLEEKFGPVVEKLIGKPLSTASKKVVIPTVLKMLSDGATPSEIMDGVDYASHAAAGAQKLNNAVNSLFKAGAVTAAPEAGDYAREKLKKYIENGEYQKQIDAANAPSVKEPGFADGGEVLSTSKHILQGTESLAKYFPEHNIMLNEARGRINNYLNSIRPTPPATKLPFDSDIKDKQQNKSYNKALDIANSPLSVLNSIKDHSVGIEHVKHMNALYPEVYQQLTNKLSEQISKHQLENKNIPYKLRQSIATFMGAPLDSTMTPQGIQSIQTTFARSAVNRQPAQKGQAPSESSMKGLDKLPNQYRTQDEARATRSQRLK